MLAEFDFAQAFYWTLGIAAVLVGAIYGSLAMQMRDVWKTLATIQSRTIEEAERDFALRLANGERLVRVEKGVEHLTKSQETMARQVDTLHNATLHFLSEERKKNEV